MSDFVAFRVRVCTKKKKKKAAGAAQQRRAQARLGCNTLYYVFKPIVVQVWSYSQLNPSLMLLQWGFRPV